MFRLAHISDIHLGPLPQVSYRELASKRVTGYINWRRNRQLQMTDGILDGLVADLKEQQPDHLAITGDLINLSLDKEIANAREWLETLGEPEDISVIPGNHDAYVPGALNKVSDSWASWMSGDDSALPVRNREFPYLRVRDGVALIGASSANASAPFRATGRFTKGQAERLGIILEEAGERSLFRVVMIHHPPVHGAADRSKRLYGINRFQKVIAEFGCELILHGHTHLATIHQIDGPNGQIPVVGVPSASQGLGGRKPAARYNLFEIVPRGTASAVRMLERGYLSGETGITTISDHMLTD